MKRIFSFVLLVCLMLSILASCNPSSDISTSNNTVMPDSKVNIVIGEKTIPINNVDKLVDGVESSLLSKNYLKDDKPCLVLNEKTANNGALTITSDFDGKEFVFTLDSISTTTENIAIPTNGFVVVLANDVIGSLSLKTGDNVKTFGDCYAFAPSEVFSNASFYVDGNESATKRQISVKDPIVSLSSDSVCFITESFPTKDITLPDASTVVVLEKIKNKSYEIKEISSSLVENKYQLVLVGAYNNEYCSTYLEVGKKIMINNIEKANSISKHSAVLFENGMIEFPNRNINTEITSEGFYLYNSELLGSVTPKTELDRVDITIVEDYVATITKNERTFVPLDNGVVITCVGEEAINFANSLKTGEQIKDKCFIEYEKLGNVYVKVGDETYNIDLIDGIRAPEGVCALYTSSFGKTTGTNMYGTEIVVEDGKVTRVEIGKGDTAIPENGYVVSIHKDHPKYSYANRTKLGTTSKAHLNGSDYGVTNLKFDGVNITRGENMIIVYNNTATTNTNMYGYELIVDKNNICVGDHYGGNAAIPEGGFVVSAHGTAVKVLENAYIIGETITYNLQTNEVMIIKTPSLRIGEAEQAIKLVVEAFDAAKEEFLTLNYPHLEKETERLEKLLTEAKSELDSGNFEKAMELSKSVKNEAELLSFETIESPFAENRAMWYRSNEKSDEEVRNTLKKLSSLNVNTLYLETWFDGYCPGFIDVEGVQHSPYNGNYDALEGFIRIAKEYNIEIHAWVENFFVGYLNKDNTFSNSILDRFKDQLLLDKEGNNFYYYNEKATFVFLDPFDRECRDYILEVYTKLIEKYDLDGIHLDYIRFPELNYGKNDYGYNKTTIEAFKKETGITADPRTFVDGSANDKKWEEFRANIITTFVGEVFDLVCEKDPSLWISCAIYPNRLDAKKNIAQDVEAWLEKGYIDEVFSMTYSGDNKYVKENAASYATITRDKAFYSTGLAAFMDTTKKNFAYQIPTVREAGADGIAIFALANINPEKYQNEIILGGFRSPSTQLYKYNETTLAFAENLKNKLNWSLSFYETIKTADVEWIISELEKITKDQSTPKTLSEKKSYVEKTVTSLESLINSIVDRLGDNDEVKSVVVELKSIIYALELTLERDTVKTK